MEVAFAYGKRVFNTTEDNEVNKSGKKEKKQNSKTLSNLMAQVKSAKPKIKLIETLNFDTNLYKAQKQYLCCMEMKRCLIQIISNDHINLKQVDCILQELSQQKEVLYNNLNSLFSLNYSSEELEQLCLDYETHLTNQTVSFTQFYAENSSRNNAFNNIKSLSSFFQFSKDSCVIFVSLLGNLGEVCKVSENFQDVVPILKNEQVIGKNVNFMMPTEISIIHDFILNNFIQKGVIQEGLADFPLLIGVDKDGWAVPYHIQVQVILISDQELGASAWIKQISKEEQRRSHYLTIGYDEKNQLIAPEIKFYEMLFSDVFSKSEVKSIQIGNLAPTLMGIVNCGLTDREQEILIIKPKCKQDCMKSHIEFSKGDFRNMESNVFHNICQYDLYLMKAELFPIKNKFVKFIQVKINSLTQLKTIQQIKENIKVFAKQLIEFNKINEDEVSNHLNQFLKSNGAFINQKTYGDLNVVDSDLQCSVVQNLVKIDTSPVTARKNPYESPVARSNLKKRNQTKIQISQSCIQTEELINLYSIDKQQQQNCSQNDYASQISLKLQMPHSQSKINSFAEIPMNSSSRKEIPPIEDNLILTTNRIILTPKESSKLLLSNQNFSTDIMSSQRLVSLQNTPLSKFNKQQKKQILNDYQPSMRSTQSTKLSLLDILLKKMQKERRDIYLLGIHLLTFLIIVFILGLNISQLATQILDQSLVSTQQRYITFSYDINSSIQNLVSYKYIKKLITYNLIPSSSTSDKTKALSLINKNIGLSFAYYQQLLSSLTLESFNEQENIFKLFSDSTMPYIIATTPSSYVSKTINLGMVIKTTYSQLLNDFYRPHLQNLVAYYTENNVMYNSILGKISETNLSQMRNFNDTNTQYLTIGLSLSLVGWFLLAFISNYTIVIFQQKKEQILKLFSTFTPSDLCEQLQNCSNATLKAKLLVQSNQSAIGEKESSQLSSQQKQSKQTNDIINSQYDNTVKKKKNISTTEGLKLFDTQLFASSFLLLIIIVACAIPTTLILQQTIQQMQSIQNSIDTISDTKQSVNYALSVTAVTSSFTLYEDTSRYVNLTLFQNQTNYLLSKSDSIVSNFINSLNNDDPSNRQLIQNIFENNACNYLDQLNQPYIIQNNFTQSYCTTIENGILQQGIVASLKVLNDKITYVMKLISSSQMNSTQFLQGYTADPSNSIQRILYLKEGIEIILEGVIIRLIGSFNSYTDTYFNFTLCIFLLETFFLIIFCIVRYQKQVLINSKKVYEMKQCLDLVDADIILKNQYFQSYFKKQFVH